MALFPRFEAVFDAAHLIVFQQHFVILGHRTSTPLIKQNVKSQVQMQGWAASLASAVVVVAFDKRADGWPIIRVVYVFVINYQIKLTRDGVAMTQRGNELRSLKSFY